MDGDLKALLMLLAISVPMLGYAWVTFRSLPKKPRP
jgi:hypothetical protein